MHVNVLSKFRFRRVAHIIGNHTERSELLRIRNEIVVIIILFRNQCLNIFSFHQRRIQGFLYTVRTFSVCPLQFVMNTPNNFHIIFCEECLPCLIPLRIFLDIFNQWQITHIDEPETFVCIEETYVSLLAFIDTFKEFREVLDEVLLVFQRLGNTYEISIFIKFYHTSCFIESFSHFCRIIWSCRSICIIEFICKEGVGTKLHVLKHKLQSILYVTTFLTTILHFESTPTSPVIAVLSAWVLNTNSQLTVFANISERVNGITTYVCSSCHTIRTMNSITNDTFTTVCCFEVIVYSKVKSACTMQITVHLVDGIVHRNIIFDYSGEVVEDTISIDAGCIVEAVAVVAGTESAVDAYEVVTGLHVLYCLEHIACYIPSFYAYYIMLVFVLNLTVSCAPCFFPVFGLAFFCALTEVAIRNQPADISTGNIVLTNCMLQPFFNTSCLCLDFLSSSSMLLYDMGISAKRVIFIGIVILCEVVFKSLTNCAREAVITIKNAFHLFTLGNVSLVNSSIGFDSFLSLTHCIKSIGKTKDCGYFIQFINHNHIIIKHALCSYYFVELVQLISTNYGSHIRNIVIIYNREVLLCSIDNKTMSGIRIRI